MTRKHRLVWARVSGALLAALAWLTSLPAEARSTRYPVYGVWLITHARPAPWANPALLDPESRRLIGRKLIYLPDRIEGPEPFACEAPLYRLVDTPPQGLFQGNLTSPVLQAAALGFREPLIATLQTDCEGFIDLHFVNRSTAMFALNNVIYTVRRR
jgi:hypothetical protein